MQEDSVPKGQQMHRPLMFALFLVGGSMLFLLGNNWKALLPTNGSTLYKWGIAVLFLALAIVLRRSERFREDWRIAFALFIAAFANALNWLLGDWLARLLPLPASQAQEIAVDKLSQCIPVVLAIILLTRLVGDDLGSIFVQKGNLGWGLRFGLISLGIFAAIFALIAVLQANAPASTRLLSTGVPLAAIVSALPWILVFVFALPHFGAPYIAPIERGIFAIVVVALGIVNASVMLKTSSIWGSVLFHAGYDLIVIIPILVSGL